MSVRTFAEVQKGQPGSKRSPNANGANRGGLAASQRGSSVVTATRSFSRGLLFPPPRGLTKKTVDALGGTGLAVRFPGLGVDPALTFVRLFVYGSRCGEVGLSRMLLFVSSGKAARKSGIKRDCRLVFLECSRVFLSKLFPAYCVAVASPGCFAFPSFLVWRRTCSTEAIKNPFMIVVLGRLSLVLATPLRLFLSSRCFVLYSSLRECANSLGEPVAI